MPFVPEADGLKMALSNCRGFRINCLPQSVPTEGVGTNKDIMASSRLTLHRQKPIQVPVFLLITLTLPSMHLTFLELQLGPDWS